VAGASTLAGRWPKPSLAARHMGRPVVPAPPGRYYRRGLGATSWPTCGKEEEAGTSGQGTGRGTAQGSKYPGNFGSKWTFFRYLHRYLRPLVPPVRECLQI
jgi:hypothetical protein